MAYDRGLYQQLSDYLTVAENEFGLIKSDRRTILQSIADYISDKLKKNKKINLIFICTQNSRRSHIAQIFAQAASYYFNLHNIRCYSGGTIVSAFNPRAVAALQRNGFQITKESDDVNPAYNVSFGKNLEIIKSFSKLYDDNFNPKDEFAAIMVCSQADEACPYISGAERRFSLPYNDPKEYDDTSSEDMKYAETCRLIATEMMYIFSNIN